MTPNGRQTDVLVKLMPRRDEMMNGYIDYDYDRLDVWADAGLGEPFSKIDGVMKVSYLEDLPTHYIVLVDPRYSAEWVLREVEAIGKIGAPEKSLPAPVDAHKSNLVVRINTKE